MAWISLGEVAKILGVNRKTVWRWTRNYEQGDTNGPELRGQRAPNSDLIFVEEADLKEFQSSHQTDIEDAREREQEKL